MKKDFIMKSIYSEIQNNKWINAIMLTCENQELLENLSNQIARILFCKNSSIEDDFCNICLKFSKQTISSFLKIGNNNSPIKKDEINQMISKFSNTNMEEFQKKIYVIANAENLNEAAANSLLKFLEEPTNNTYAILLSNDKSMVIPTIKSRCRIYNIDFKSNSLKDNIIFNLINSTNKEDILLSGKEMKKFEKEDLIFLLKDCYKKIIKTNKINIATHIVDALNKLNTTNYTNLIIENLLINIYEGI